MSDPGGTSADYREFWDESENRVVFPVRYEGSPGDDAATSESVMAVVTAVMRHIQDGGAGRSVPEHVRDGAGVRVDLYISKDVLDPVTLQTLAMLADFGLQRDLRLVVKPVDRESINDPDLTWMDPTP